MPSQSFKRAERVSQLLQRELSQIFVNGLTDHRVGFVTVTEVRMGDDLRNAKVFVSTLGSEQERAETLEAIREASGFIRREVGHRVHLKYVPQLSFWPDETLDRAARLDALLDESKSEPSTASPNEALVTPETIRSQLAESYRNNLTPKPKKTTPAGKSRTRRKRKGR